MDNSYPSYIPPSQFQAQSSYLGGSQQQYSQPYSPPPLPSQAPQHQQQQQYYLQQVPTHASNYPSYVPPQPYQHTTSPYKQHQPKHEQRDSKLIPTSDTPKHAPGELEGVVVRTKFPVARIKRIVQADEDVGKVAQVTPVVVSKALELFMISIALRSADIARASGVKRVTAQHLKAVVQRDEQFDFLRDTVAKVPDGPTAVGGAAKAHAGKSGGGAKSEDSEDDLQDDAGVAAGRKRRARGAGAGKSRKRREDS